jgi:hypothetical protein
MPQVRGYCALETLDEFSDEIHIVEVLPRGKLKQAAGGKSAFGLTPG